MTVPPPFQVPLLIVSAYPELLLVPAERKAIVDGYVNGAPGLDPFRALIQQQGPPTPSGGWARQVTIGSVTRLDLSSQTLAALPALLSQVLNPAMQDPQLQGFCWTVQNGIVPGEEPVSSPSGDWLLAQVPPQNGLEFSDLSYSGQHRSFSIKVANRMPRHLGVYVEFQMSGLPVSPAGWTSRLPAGVPSDYESSTVKYLTSLLPNTAVAGIAVSTTPQSLAVALPANADSARIVFGGIGNGGWNSPVDVAGVVQTIVLDCGVPLVITKSGKPVPPSWLQQLLMDQTVAAEILSAAAGLLSDSSIIDLATMLGALATQTPSLMLNHLPTLRSSLEDQFGDDAVLNAAPSLGWPAATLKSLLLAQVPTSNELYASTSQLLGGTSTFGIHLSPATAIDLDLQLLPEADWPFQAAGYSVTIRYGGGFWQQQRGPLVPATAGDSLAVPFGTVRHAETIDVAAQIRDRQQMVLATGSATVDSAASNGNRVVRAALPLQNEPVTVSPQTRFVHAATLTCDGGQYAWNAQAPQPPAVRLGAVGSGNTPAVTRLTALTCQQSPPALGYVWCASGQGIPSCGGGTPLQTACFLQNIGPVNPATQLQAINCGFAQQPYLAYQAQPGGATAGTPAGYFVDPRGPQPALRAVTFQPGVFDLSTAASYGRFRESPLADVALHPAGCAVAVSWDNSRLEIVTLSEAPVADADAPLSQVLAGPGQRPGLIFNPVAVAVTPGGMILVLEQGNSRVQCFDIHGNPVPAFGGSPFLALQAAAAPVYLDLAVSPSGLIYVLSNQNGGATAADSLLDVYTAAGEFLSRTTGVTAARIAIGPRESLYTLNYGTLTGPGGRIEPSLSLWLPSN